MHPRISSRSFSLSLSLVVALAACGKKKDDPAPDPKPTPGSAAPTPGSAAPTPGSAAPTPGSAAPTPGSTAPTPGSAAPTDPAAPPPKANPQRATTAIVEGAACPTGTTRVTDTPLTIDGATVSFARDRGCGCPTKPVYTLVHTKASPTEVRLCFDPTADMCEAMCVAEKVSFDLSDAFKASGATAAVAGK